MRKLTYIGRRIVQGKGDTKPKLQRCFAEDDESQTWWPSAKAHHYLGFVIGAMYESDEGKFPKRESECGFAGEDKALLLQVHDQAALKDAEAQKIKPAPNLDRTIETLGRARLSLPASKRQAFDVWLLNELSKWRK